MLGYVDHTLALGYSTGAAIRVSILIAVLITWRFSIGSLSVSNIRSFKVEMFHWTAMLFSNTLGTAFGDLLADSSGLGFVGGAALVGSKIARTVLAYYFTNISRTALFWIGFVLTRPLGATMGDLLTKVPVRGGIDFGTIGSSVVLAVILIACIVLTMRQNNRRALAP